MPHTQGSVCPTRHFCAPGSRASETELLLTCSAPSHRTVVNLGQSKCTDCYLWFNVYMVFSSTKDSNIGQQGKQVLLFICIWPYYNHHSDSSAMTDYRCMFSTSDCHCKINQLHGQNTSAHLTNDASYWLKQLLMQLNRAIYKVCDLIINPHICFSRPCHMIGLGQSR